MPITPFEADARYQDLLSGANRNSPAPWTANSSILNSVIPGAPNLTSSASNIVGQLLAGQPGTSRARSAAAYYGAGSGMPGSEFVNRVGFDLYNREGEQRQQQGLQDLLSMIAGYTGPALQQRGQDIQREQFDKNYNLELSKYGFDQNRYSRQSPQRNRNGIFRMAGENYGGVPGASNIPYL